MNWGAFFITLPVNALIIWFIYKDILDYNERIEQLGRAFKY